MMLEIDLLSIKQIELTYLPKLRKLLYLLAGAGPHSPNISQLSNDIATSRATVMNYIKYLKDARLINMLYPEDEEFPKKPAMVYMQNSNLLYPICLSKVDRQPVIETFFYSQIHKDYKVNLGEKSAQFLVDSQYSFRIEEHVSRAKAHSDMYYVVDGIETGEGSRIPLWLFGFLY
jgi:predicted AAA+ superfamily ATPase